MNDSGIQKGRQDRGLSAERLTWVALDVLGVATQTHALIQKSGIVFAKGPNGRGCIHGWIHANPEGFRTGLTIALTAQKST